jgi:hypothetical protein
MKKNIASCGITGSDWKRIFILFLFGWLAVNVVQAVFTEMMSDDSYYSLYGEN